MTSTSSSPAAANLAQAQYRYGDWGPAYLLRGPQSDLGVFRIPPGEEMSNHYHARTEESFVCLDGEVTLWTACREQHTLRAGDVHRCVPGEMHYFVNEAAEPFRAVFVKAPYNPEDTIQVPWHPGEPVPEAPSID
jgi:quercetin dioxygenase-like cupin family protein